MSIDTSQVTIVIPHLGGTKESEYALDQCLQSLKETFTGKVIIAINGNKCFRHAPEALIIPEQGQCRAVNAAVATVETPWVFVTNDDMNYAPGWFDKLAESAGQQANSFLCISPKLIEPIDGAPTFEKYFCGGAGGDFDKLKWLEFALAYKENISLRPGFNLPFLIKKELWDLIGGYDMNYDPWGSNGDSDLEYKIRLAGIQPYQCPKSIVYHFSQTSGTSHPDNRPYWQKNWDYFIAKWGFERASGAQIWEANFVILEDQLKYKPWWKGFYAQKSS